MIRAARLSAIEDLLRERHVLSTAQLAEELKVSSATARRDLQHLDEAGRIDRVFGGAQLRTTGSGRSGGSFGNDGSSSTAPEEPANAGESAASDAGDPDDQGRDDPFDEVLARNSAAKRAIASAAVELIRDGETVFIDAGTTTYEFARLLASRSLTVVTNSLGIVSLLGEAEGIDLIVLGGAYNREYRSTQGKSVRDALGTLLIDRAVIGCAGITESGEIRDTDQRGAAVKLAAIGRAGSAMLLADASKFPGRGAYTALDLTQITEIVTDKPLSAALTALAEVDTTEVHLA